MTLDPAVLVGAAVGLVTLQLTSLGILLAVLRFFYLRLDRRFSDIDCRFAEVRTDIDRRFADSDRRFAEVGANIDRRFTEAGADLDRRFAEAGANIDRRFTEAGADLDRRFAEVDRRFGEAGADVDRRFAEVLAAMQTGFAEARDDRRRIEEKLDRQGKDLARLQGIVERTHEPHRFTVGAPDTTRTAPRPASDIPDEPGGAPMAAGNP